MPFSAAETAAVARLAAWALEEDLGDNGDLTSQATIPADLDGRAVLVARTSGVVAGLPAAEYCFHAVDAALVFSPLVADSSLVQRDTQLATVAGRMRSILTGERTALNFLQRLSGVATQTWRYTSLVADLPVQILDTRKTTPGWRVLEKYAVRCGGGHNHRMGLGDGILIKDNHLAALVAAASRAAAEGPARLAGPTSDAIAEAVRRARQLVGTRFPLEIEVDNLTQLDVALTANPDIVLLDNMSLDDMREAVRRRNAVAPKVKLEASGGVTFATLRGIAETGVDRISVGALTHSAVALDIALDYLS
jgi:nicotinate-nucleotide pyrophosphorylase (carboxylating)